MSQACCQLPVALLWRAANRPPKSPADVGHEDLEFANSKSRSIALATTLAPRLPRTPTLTGRAVGGEDVLNKRAWKKWKQSDSNNRTVLWTAMGSLRARNLSICPAGVCALHASDGQQLCGDVLHHSIHLEIDGRDAAQEVPLSSVFGKNCTQTPRDEEAEPTADWTPPQEDCARGDHVASVLVRCGA